MNRRIFLKSGTAVAIGSTVLNTNALASSLLATRSTTINPANVYDRPLHTVYPLRGGNISGPPPTDDELLAAFDMVHGGLTAAIPFLLNVPDPSKFEPMIHKVQAKGITIIPGVGRRPSQGPINSQNYKDIARAYRQYTDYIRIENMQGFYDMYGQAPMQDMIDYLTGTLGFQHVMMNPWPLDSNGNVVPFKNPELDSSFNNVMLDFDHHIPYTVHPNPKNWLVNQTYVGKIQAYRPSIKIVVNYESQPQHEALYYMEKSKSGSSTAAMNITANQCENSPNHLHWCPPFTHIYDPLALGTWPWIAKRLGA